MNADLIVLAAIAIFVLLRLRSVLGQKIGHDQPPLKPGEPMEDSDRVIRITPKNRENSLEDSLREALREPEIIPEEFKDAVGDIRAIDPAFSLRDFLKGAETAFEMVVTAFARDQRETLKSLLSKDLFAQFRDLLEARKTEATHEETTLVAILSAKVTQVSLKKSTAIIRVRFESEQIRVTRDKEGKIASGDPSSIQSAEDEWVFERDVRSSNPNWTITAT